MSDDQHSWTREELIEHGIDPDSSPFELPAVEGIPFDKDSDEARAIQRVIEEADRERAEQKRRKAS